MHAFDNAQRAADFFKEEAEAAVLGMKTPQAAMDDLTRRVRPLLQS
jgi:multiple sugar transport system substrate-binding protein